MSRALLISLRDPHDAMAGHERRCFAERSGLALDELDVHHMAESVPSDARLRDADVLIFGGSGAYAVYDDVPWIKATLDVLLRVIELGVPCWASCFGFQGLAVALGGEVIRDDEQTEMGSTLLTLTEAGRRDPLLGVLPTQFWAQEGHHDRVSRIPEGVELLATGSLCHAQAFKVKGAPFWATQFHPELTVERTIDRFHFYGDHYLPEGRDEMLAVLASGAETPEMGDVLTRFVRREF